MFVVYYCIDYERKGILNAFMVIFWFCLLYQINQIEKEFENSLHVHLDLSYSWLLIIKSLWNYKLVLFHFILEKETCNVLLF